MQAAFRDALTAAVLPIRPLLNRLVFYGIETCRGDLDGAVEVRAPKSLPRSLHALATAQLTRLAPELLAAGVRRVGRGALGENWEVAGGVVLAIESAADGIGDNAESALLEYATLLTTSVKLESGDIARVCSLPTQLPLMWRAHLRTGAELSASEWAEEIVELVMRRRGLRQDIQSLPPELRALVTQAAHRFATSDSALWTIEHALPDARTAPGLADEALKVFRELAQIAA